MATHTSVTQRWELGVGVETVVLLVVRLAPDALRDGLKRPRLKVTEQTSQHPPLAAAHMHTCTCLHRHAHPHALHTCVHTKMISSTAGIRSVTQGEAVVVSKWGLASLIHLGLKYHMQVMGQTSTRGSRQRQQEYMGPCSQMLWVRWVNDTRDPQAGVVDCWP